MQHWLDLNLTRWINPISGENSIMPDQSGLVETGKITRWLANITTIWRWNNIILYTLPAHYLQHLLSSTLIQTRSGVAITNVGLDVKGRGRHPCIYLVRECRKRCVIAEFWEHKPHALRDMRKNESTISICHCEGVIWVVTVEKVYMAYTWPARTRKPPGIRRTTSVLSSGFIAG